MSTVSHDLPGDLLPSLSIKKLASSTNRTFIKPVNQDPSSNKKLLVNRKPKNLDREENSIDFADFIDNTNHDDSSITSFDELWSTIPDLASQNETSCFAAPNDEPVVASVGQSTADASQSPELQSEVHQNFYPHSFEDHSQSPELQSEVHQNFSPPSFEDQNVSDWNTIYPDLLASDDESLWKIDDNDYNLQWPDTGLPDPIPNTSKHFCD